eukprot:9239656-Pyramimonas_sp.AAC.1
MLTVPRQLTAAESYRITHAPAVPARNLTCSTSNGVKRAPGNKRFYRSLTAKTVRADIQVRERKATSTRSQIPLLKPC